MPSEIDRSLFVDKEVFIDSNSQFSDLLDLCFSLPEGCHFLDDFPVWQLNFDIQPLLRVGVYLREQLISVAGVRVAFLKSKESLPVKVAIIGAVATHPSCRGMGFASRLVSLALEWAQKKNCTQALLWSGGSRLYEKLGFKWVGSQVRLPIGLIRVQGGVSQKVYYGWNPKLFQLIKSRGEGLLLKDEDRVWFEAHKNVEWLYVGSVDQPKAYVGVGRGIDLPQIIHEWGGEKQSLDCLFNFLKDKNPSQMILCSPRHCQELGVDLSQVQIEPLCMAKKLVAGAALDPAVWVWGLDAA